MSIYNVLNKVQSGGNLRYLPRWDTALTKDVKDYMKWSKADGDTDENGVHPIRLVPVYRFVVVHRAENAADEWMEWLCCDWDYKAGEFKKPVKDKKKTCPFHGAEGVQWAEMVKTKMYLMHYFIHREVMKNTSNLKKALRFACFTPGPVQLLQKHSKSLGLDSLEHGFADQKKGRDLALTYDGQASSPQNYYGVTPLDPSPLTKEELAMIAKLVPIEERMRLDEVTPEPEVVRARIATFFGKTETGADGEETATDEEAAEDVEGEEAAEGDFEEEAAPEEEEATEEEEFEEAADEEAAEEEEAPAEDEEAFEEEAAEEEEAAADEEVEAAEEGEDEGWGEEEPAPVKPAARKPAPKPAVAAAPARKPAPAPARAAAPPAKVGKPAPKPVAVTKPVAKPINGAAKPAPAVARRGAPPPRRPAAR